MKTFYFLRIFTEECTKNTIIIMPRQNYRLMHSNIRKRTYLNSMSVKNIASQIAKVPLKRWNT